MAENVYEGMFILDANRYARDPSGLPNQVEKLIQDAGGELIVSRLWEERRLAYPIQGQRKGVYWLTYFRIDGAKMQRLGRQVEINDAILRHLFLVIDPKLVDAMIAHASGAVIGGRSAEIAVDDNDEDDVEEDGDFNEPIPTANKTF